MMKNEKKPGEMSQGLKKILNTQVNMERVLRQVYGVVPNHQKAFPCPFPDHGSVDVHPSARYFPDTNEVYCFAEQRTYSVYDVLKATGKTDMELTSFVINKLGAENTHVVLKHNVHQLMSRIEGSISSYTEGVFSKFKRGELTWLEVLPVVRGYFEALDRVTTVTEAPDVG
jgi:hypothetical protein